MEKGYFSNQNENKKESQFFTPARVAVDFCQQEENIKKSKGKERCYAKELEKFAQEHGFKASFEVLYLLQDIDISTKGCHFIAHGIGIGSYKRSPKDWRTLIQNMPSNCNYGGIHGVLEGHVASYGELAREIIPTICGANPRADCNHIIGHLLLVQTNGDIYETLHMCEVFKDYNQRDFCLTGVFMEEQTAVNLVEHGLAPESYLDWASRLPELEKLCRSLSGEHASACWKEIVHAALVKFENDPKKTWDFCNSAQTKKGGERCVRHSIGIISAGKRFNLPELRFMCSIPQENYSRF